MGPEYEDYDLILPSVDKINVRTIAEAKRNRAKRLGTRLYQQNKAHGRITEELGKMYLMLAERYAQRSNWRGYTYVEEMKGQAILQLSQIGLQFDESKSENPFAYYTAAVTNSFTRVLNIEKRMQNIRDDMLEESGLTPSFTRQNQQEYAEETARQAALYKGMRQAKSEDTPEEEAE